MPGFVRFTMPNIKDSYSFSFFQNMSQLFHSDVWRRAVRNFRNGGSAMFEPLAPQPGSADPSLQNIDLRHPHLPEPICGYCGADFRIIHQHDTCTTDSGESIGLLDKLACLSVTGVGNMSGLILAGLAHIKNIQRNFIGIRFP